MSLTRSMSLRLVAALLGVVVLSAPALAETASLAARLPKGANAVLTIDVEKLVQSPVGKGLGLQSKMLAGSAERPLAVPASAKGVAIGALIHPAGVKAIWQAAVIDLPSAPRLEPILRAQGGYMDQVGGKPAAWTPRDTFFVALDERTMGAVRPGQRPFVNRWVSGKLEKGLSPYLSTAVNSGANEVFVFAVDLDQAVGITALKYAVAMGQLPSLEQVTTGRDRLLPALASVTGTKLTVRATNQLDGEWTIDFAQDVGALGAQAKPFVIDVLTAADLYEPDMDQWEFKAEGKKIVGKRVVELAGLDRILALMSPGHAGGQGGGPSSAPEAKTAGASEQAAAQPAGQAAAEPAGQPAGHAAPANDAATASRNYYRAVAKALDTIKTKPSPSQGASWLIAQSRMIQQLPVLNVDTALLEWGSGVADAFTRAAEELALGQQRAMSAANGVASPVAYTTYDYDAGWNSSDSAETRAAYRNARQERQRVAQNERGAAAERAFGCLNGVMAARGQIRAEMTQKYGVEF